MRAHLLAYRLLHLGPLEPFVRRVSAFACFGLWPRVLGRRHVPRRGPLVVTGTHENRHDVLFLLLATGRHLQFVGNEDFLDIPVYGAVVRMGGWFSVRDASDTLDTANATALDDAAAATRAGGAVAIFTQGFTRRIGGGAMRIAAAAEAPIVPVFIYRLLAEPATPRALVVARRPLPPPAPDARARRRFRRRLGNRMRAMGALRHDDDAADILNVVLDDAAQWRDPLRVIRWSARVPRLDPAVAAPLGRRARYLRRGCAALRCSVGDLRRPAVLGRVAALLALLPPACVGALLSSPPVLMLLFRLRRSPMLDIRTAVFRLSATLALPWAIVLALVGVAGWGACGLLLPVAAIAGACCAGPAVQMFRRVRGAVAVRRRGGHLAEKLAAFDRDVGTISRGA